MIDVPVIGCAPSWIDLYSASSVETNLEPPHMVASISTQQMHTLNQAPISVDEKNVIIQGASATTEIHNEIIQNHHDIGVFIIHSHCHHTTYKRYVSSCHLSEAA